MRHSARRDGQQYRLHFPLTFQDISIPAPASGRDAIIRDRQPKKFPRGWSALALSDPDWREKHYANWQASRKALGLPYLIHDMLEAS
jgi:hypothetical protein